MRRDSLVSVGVLRDSLVSVGVQRDSLVSVGVQRDSLVSVGVRRDRLVSVGVQRDRPWKQSRYSSFWGVLDTCMMAMGKLWAEAAYTADARDRSFLSRNSATAAGRGRRYTHTHTHR